MLYERETEAKLQPRKGIETERQRGEGEKG